MSDELRKALDSADIAICHLARSLPAWNTTYGSVESRDKTILGLARALTRVQVADLRDGMSQQGHETPSG